jgi:hypothetical protein
MFTAALSTKSTYKHNRSQTAVFIKLCCITHTFPRGAGNSLLTDGFMARCKHQRCVPCCLTRPKIIPNTLQNNGYYRLTTRSICDDCISRHTGNCVTTRMNVYKQCHTVTDTKHTTHITHTTCTLELHNLHAEWRASNWLKLRWWTSDSRQRACEVEMWHFTRSSSKRVIKTEDWLYKYYCYYYYYYYLLQLSFHSVAVVLTLVQTKQIRIKIRKRNNTI